MPESIPESKLESMLKIGAFSKLSRVSIRMLRHYNALGLLVPALVDGETAYRYYSADQLATAARIRALQEMGFSLSVIRELLAYCGDPGRLRDYLALQLASLTGEAQRLRERIARVSSAIRDLESEEYLMKFDVTVKELPAMIVAGVRQILPAYEREGELWHILMKELSDRKIEPDSPGYPISIYHDEGFKERDIDVEVRINVKEPFTGSDRVRCFKTQPVLYASAILKGGFDHITEANRAVAAWIAENGYEINGTMFDIGHVNPGSDPRPEHWVTEICLPVRRIGG